MELFGGSDSLEILPSLLTTAVRSFSSRFLASLKETTCKEQQYLTYPISGDSPSLKQAFFESFRTLVQAIAADHIQAQIFENSG